MRKLAQALMTVFMGCQMVAADEQDEKLQLTLSTKAWSSYVFNSGVEFHDEPVVQTDAFLQLRHGFYLDLWWSAGLDDTYLSSNFGDEVDYTVGWSDDVGKKLILDVGVSYFDIINLFDSGETSDVIKSYAKLSRTFPVGRIHELTPLFAIEWHKPLKGNFDGVYTWTGLRYRWQVSDLFSLNSEAGLLYDSGAYGFESAIVWYANAELSWQLNETISLQLPSVRLTTPLGHKPDRETQLVFGAGMSFNF